MINRLNRQVEEVLYPAMEDYAIDILVGKGQVARSTKLETATFTLSRGQRQELEMLGHNR